VGLSARDLDQYIIEIPQPEVLERNIILKQAEIHFLCLLVKIFILYLKLQLIPTSGLVLVTLDTADGDKC
jgi:hypothetical protein